jgi:hypothetical protein
VVKHGETQHAVNEMKSTMDEVASADPMLMQAMHEASASLRPGLSPCASGTTSQPINRTYLEHACIARPGK